MPDRASLPSPHPPAPSLLPPQAVGEGQGAEE